MLAMLATRTNRARSARSTKCGTGRVDTTTWLQGLLAEDFFDVANFALDFAAGFFHGPAILQVTVPGRLAGFFFDLAFHFLRGAFDFVFRARFHTCESGEGAPQDAGLKVRSKKEELKS
jgi:hypothetical protein